MTFATQSADELNAISIAAREAINAAKLKVQKGLEELEAATRIHLHAEAVLSEDPVGTLVAHGNSARTTWGGGHSATVSNIEGNLQREAVLGLIVRDQWKRKVPAV